MYPPAPPPPPRWEDADPNFPPAPSAPPADESLGLGAENSAAGGQRPAALPSGVVVRGLPVPPVSPVPWSSGLFDCFDDVGNCCLTCLCPCITFGRVAEIADGGATSCAGSGALYAAVLCLTGCSCLYSCFYRAKLRRQFFLQEAPFADCVVHCCCESCALCQEHRELAVRGFDMRRGWKGNLEREGRTVLTLPPTVEGGMTR